MELIVRLREFIENEMRSCSMDIGGITPVCQGDRSVASEINNSVILHNPN